MQIDPCMAVCSSKECACRDVTTERKPYPSFAPEDFPAVYEASQKALQLASLAQAKAPESQARHFCHLGWHLNRHTQLTCIMAATVLISCMLHASARSYFGSRLRRLWEASLPSPGRSNLRQGNLSLARGVSLFILQHCVISGTTGTPRPILQ